MKMIFIDRDGVINKDPGGWTKYSYVTKWKDFHFLPRSKKAIKMLSDRGYDIVVISNQAGVGKGFYSSSRLKTINSKMLKEIESSKGKIKKVYYCIHQESDKCGCRKPKTGLFRKAERQLGLKAFGCYFIGDGKMDVEAGKRTGLKNILLLSGKTNLEDVSEWKVKPDFIFKDLLEAVRWLLGKRKGAE